jgi:hypothetical protein
MATFNTGDSVSRNMTIRVGGVLTNADPGYTAILYVNGTATVNPVTSTNPAVGEYVFTYLVPAGLTNNSVLAVKVVGVVSGTGFTHWLEDQYSDQLTGIDYSCIADWVLRQPVASAETSVCPNIPAANANSLLYLVKYMAPYAAWFQTVTTQPASCSCGSITCNTCQNTNCCY